MNAADYPIVDPFTCNSGISTEISMMSLYTQWGRYCSVHCIPKFPFLNVQTMYCKNLSALSINKLICSAIIAVVEAIPKK
jgi:hypothetical protein